MKRPPLPQARPRRRRHSCRFVSGRTSKIYPGTRSGFEGAGNDVCLREANPLEIKHCCVDCGQVIAVHEHSSYVEVKLCLRGMRALCDECRRFQGCPLPERTRGQENHHE